MTTSNDYLKRSIAYLVRRVLQVRANETSRITQPLQKVGPTLEGLGRFCQPPALTFWGWAPQTARVNECNRDFTSTI